MGRGTTFWHLCMALYLYLCYELVVGRVLYDIGIEGVVSSAALVPT